MRRRSRLHLGLSVIVCLATTAVFAQSEKINLPAVPKPGQTVRLTMTQEMDIDISFDGATPPGPMKMKTTMTMTQKTGALRPDGSMDVDMTYDQVRAEVTMNGQAIPAGTENPLAGKTVTVKYNRNGQIVDVMGLPEVAGMTADVFKQLMSSFTGNVPTEPIAVGEAFNTPLNVNLPLPLPGNAPIGFSGETRTTLLSVDRDASGRSATLDEIVTGSMIADVPSPDGKTDMKVDVTMSGSGTRVMDLDRGVLRSMTSTSVMRGRTTMGSAAPAQMRSMRLEATTKVTITSN